MYKVIYTSKHSDDVEYIMNNLTGDFEFHIRSEHVGTDEDMLIEQCKDADIAVCDFEPFTRRVLESLPKLKLLQFTGVGFNECDIEAATELGIAVCNCPHYCKNEVADHALALMLAINRRLFQYDRAVQEDAVWASTVHKDMRPMRELTLGLAGFGNVPKEVAKRAQVFVRRIISYDPYIPAEVMAAAGVEKASLDEFLAESDYISCHLPATQDTIGFFGRDSFAKCKDGVVFINTSRGLVVDEDAFLEALDSGKVSFAGLDVLMDEQPDLKNHPLCHRENVIITPHAAFYSSSARRNGRIEAANSIVDYMAGRYDKAPIKNKVRGGRK